MTNLTDKLSYNISPAEEKIKSGFKRFNLNPIQNYPIDFFFIDFAFPEIKMGIELDSFAWHINNEKDLRRHDYITNKGWKLHHFMAKLVFINPKAIPAFIYLNYFNKDKTLERVAKWEIFKVVKYKLNDRQIKNALDEII